MHTYTCLYSQEILQGSSLRPNQLCSEPQVWSSRRKLGWLASELQRPSQLFLPIAEMTGAHPHFWLTSFLGTELRSSCTLMTAIPLTLQTPLKEQFLCSFQSRIWASKFCCSFIDPLIPSSVHLFLFYHPRLW